MRPAGPSRAGPWHRRPGHQAAHGQGLDRRGLEGPAHPRPGRARRSRAGPERRGAGVPLPGGGAAGHPVPARRGHRRHRLLRGQRPAGAGRGRRPGRVAARGGGAAVRPRRGAAHPRGSPGQLARHAPALPARRHPHGARRGRPLGQVPQGRQRALPAHRPGGDHAGHRPRGPLPAGPQRRLAGPAGLDPGRVRGTGGVRRAGRDPRGRRGDRDHGHQRPLPGQPALADAAQPDARLPGRRARGPGHRRRPRGTGRGPLVEPRRPARRAAGPRAGPAPVGVDRPAHHRGLVRRPPAVHLDPAPGR